jgi:hypothetical protein
VWVAEQLLLDLDEYAAFTDVETGENLSGVKEGFWECWSIISVLSAATSRI